MSVDALITEVLQQARGIAEDVQRRVGVRMRTATVTSADPLRIRYDGEDDASVVTPRTVVRPQAGDRVAVAKTRGQATVLGILGGSAGGGVTFSPRIGGVVGDGVVDDTAAWNALLAALPAGATVQCPPGDLYLLTGPVDVAQPVTIEGGTWLAHNTGKCLRLESSDVTLRDLSFRAASADPDSSHGMIYGAGTEAAPLERLTVEGVTVDGCRYIAVWLQWVRDVLVTRCTIEHFQYAGVMLLSATRAEVSSCFISDGIQGGDIVNSYGIATTDLGNTDAARCRDVVISRNRIADIPHWEGIDTHGGQRVTVTDNIVTGCYDGIAAVAGNSSRNTAPRDVVIVGNIIDAQGAPSPRAGIRLWGITDGPQASGTVTGNHVTGYPTDLEVGNVELAASVLSPAPWVQMSLGSGWSEYAGGGGYVQGARARRIDAGVQVEAMVAGGSTGSTMFSLPSGLEVGTSSQIGGIASGSALAVAYVNAASDVIYLDGPDAPSFVNLSAILPD